MGLMGRTCRYLFVVTALGLPLGCGPQGGDVPGSTFGGPTPQLRETLPSVNPQPEIPGNDTPRPPETPLPTTKDPATVGEHEGSRPKPPADIPDASAPPDVEPADAGVVVDLDAGVPSDAGL